MDAPGVQDLQLTRSAILRRSASYLSQIESCSRLEKICGRTLIRGGDSENPILESGLHLDGDAPA